MNVKRKYTLDVNERLLSGKHKISMQSNRNFVFHFDDFNHACFSINKYNESFG